MKANKSNENGLDLIKGRIKLISVFIVLCFIILVFRFWYLQVIKGDEFKYLSENNRLRKVLVRSPRGKILDRSGNLIADVRPSFNLSIVGEDVKDLDKLVFAVSERLGIDEEKLMDKIKSASPFRPLLIKRDISREDVAFFEENRIHFAGINLDVEPIRYYLNGPIMAHILGYISEISEKELSQAKDDEYYLGSLIGHTGLEKVFEKELKGKHGSKQIEVDAYGRELRVVRSVESKPGSTVTLTLSMKLQKLAAELLEGKNGAIVVIDPRSGEILALASNPSFDPNLFASGISAAEWNKLTTNKYKPLQNKALQGQFPPGSIYKIVVATAALEEGIISPMTSFNCPGFFSFGGRIFNDWKKGGHGRLSLHRAIVESCDVYFYNVGARLNVDTLARYAKGFGFGRFTEVSLPEEKPGIVPSSDWKLKTIGERWYAGETISLAIGQGYNLVTPIQIASMIGAVANGGTRYRPALVKKIESIDGKSIYQFKPEIVGTLPARPATLKIIREALKGVVNDPHGTGFRAKINGITVAGKTGTAQVAKLRDEWKTKDFEKIPEEFRDHAWFVAFAPFEQPELAIAILIENAGQGGSRFASLAKRIIESYFGIEPEQEEKKRVALILY